MSDIKTQLKNVATDAIQRKGFTELSFRTLASDVGIKSASVHYYFPRKQDLANALIEKYAEDFELLLDNIDSDKVKLRDKLDGFVAIFERVLKDEKFCLCGMLAAEVETLDEEGRLLLSRYFQLSEGWLSSVLKTGKDELATNITPKKLARIILSGLEGAILLDRVDRSKTRLLAQRDLIRSFIK
ncbi:MAG: TetR/AcrR family transcriptional regulator [Acidiferrobacterales bacterium]|nr:TetR/AcrR family transcriptional regulator [Acidiferrobacterales bacterium]